MSVGIVKHEIYLEHVIDDYHPESPQRLEHVYAMLDEMGPDGLVFIPPRMATEEEIALVHEPGYIGVVASTKGNTHTRLDPDTQVVNLSAYIYQAIRNRIVDSLRKKKRAVAIESFADQEQRNYLLNTITDETEEENEYTDIEPALLREAIAELRPDEQAVIIATVFEERSYEELSEEWEVPVGTLLSRKHRALSKLHKILVNKKNNHHGNN